MIPYIFPKHLCWLKTNKHLHYKRKKRKFKINLRCYKNAKSNIILFFQRWRFWKSARRQPEDVERWSHQQRHQHQSGSIQKSRQSLQRGKLFKLCLCAYYVSYSCHYSTYKCQAIINDNKLVSWFLNTILFARQWWWWWFGDRCDGFPSPLKDILLCI